MNGFSRFLFGRHPGKRILARLGKPVTRRGQLVLEALEDRTLLAVTVPAPGVPGPATITGSSSLTQFVIRLQPGAILQLSDNGGTTFAAAALADVTSITVRGVAGNNVLTIDNSFGLVGKTATLSISYDGGPGSDTLLLRGNPGGPPINESYTVGAASDAGTVNLSNTTASLAISFVRLELIADTVPAANLTITANDAANYIQVINGNPGTGFTTTRVLGIDRHDLNLTLDDSNDPSVGGPVVDETGEAFVPMDFANKANVTVNAQGGDDFVVLNNPNPATGLGSITIDGGGGFNLAAQRRVPPGVRAIPLNFARIDVAPQDIFVDEIYELRLHRPPAREELAAWESILNGPGGALAVAAGIETSAEARARLVQAWYFKYLGRLPFNGEEQGWVRALLLGASEEQALAGILASDEFFVRAGSFFNTGNANENFVRTLYRLVLNRTAGSGEVSGWLGALPRIGRAAVAFAFLTSREFRADMVAAFYLSILHRGADPGGVDGWVNSGFDLARIRIGFLSSNEFISNG